MVHLLYVLYQGIKNWRISNEKSNNFKLAENEAREY